MSKFKFTFTNIFLWLGLIASALLIENVAFLTSTPTGTLSDTYFYMFLVVALSSYALMFLFEHLYNKTKVDVVILIPLLLFLGIGLLGIWLFKDVNFFPDDPSKVISLSIHDKTRLSISFGMFILTLYCVLFIFIKNHFSLRNIGYFFVIYILAMYVTIIYSLVKEFDCYKDIFTQGNYNDIKSLFWNTNVFSGALVMGICAAIVLNLIKKNVLSYVSIAVFFIEILITCSVLSVLIASIALAVYFLTEIILSWKKHPARSFAYLALYLVLGVDFVGVFAFSIADMMGPLSKFFRYLYHEIANINYSTFSNRVDIWKATFRLMGKDPTKLAFGYGFDVSKQVINSYMASLSPTGEASLVSTHNGFLQIFLNFGLVGVVIYLAFLIYYFYAAARLMVRHKRFAVIALIVGFIMLLYSIGESVIFFNCNTQGLLVGVMFYVPILLKYKHEKHPEVTRAIFTVPYNGTALKNKNVVKITSFLLFSLVCTAAPFCFMDSIRNVLEFREFSILAISTLGVLWLFTPYLVGQWHKDTKLKYFKIRLLLNILFILMMFMMVFMMFFLFDPNYNEHYVYATPCILGGVLLLDLIYYCIIRKPSFKDFLATFVIIGKCALPGTIASVGGSILLLFFYQGALEVAPLTYIIIGVYSMLLYYGVNLIFMNKELKEHVTYLNNIHITYIKRQKLLDKEREARYV